MGARSDSTRACLSQTGVDILESKIKTEVDTDNFIINAIRSVFLFCNSVCLKDRNTLKVILMLASIRNIFFYTI